jgi:hypothetical protein
MPLSFRRPGQRGYSVSAGDARHPRVQVALLLGGGVLVFETLVDALEAL